MPMETIELFYTVSKSLDRAHTEKRPAALNSSAPEMALEFWNQEKQILSQFIAADLDDLSVVDTIRGWSTFPVNAIWQTVDCSKEVDERKLIVAVRWPEFQAANRNVSLLVHFIFTGKGQSTGPRVYPLPIEKSEVALKSIEPAEPEEKNGSNDSKRKS